MKQNLRTEARRLREQGLSLKQIANMLGASKSSVSLWIRDVQLTDEQKFALNNRRRLYGELNAGAQANIVNSKATRLAYQEAGRAHAREMRPLHMAGCMLYWAEGAKARNGIYFVNSDPNMILLFARFLRVELSVNDNEFAIRIHCHTAIPEEIRQI
jgi:predicted transcriptional regulator